MPAKAKAKQAKVDAKNASTKPASKTPPKPAKTSPPKPIVTSKSKAPAKPQAKVSPPKDSAPKRSAPVDDKKKDGGAGVKKTKS